MGSSKRRALDSVQSASKRTKFTTSPFNRRFRRSAADVNSSDQDCFLSVRVVMVWPNTDNHTVCFEDMAPGHHGPRNFEVVFAGKCNLFWSHLELSRGDELLLSMRGSSFTPLVKSRHNNMNLPFRLTYENGCAVKFIQRLKRRQDNNTVVDLFEITSSVLIDTDGANVKDVVHLDTSSQISTQRTIAKEQTLDPDVSMFLAPPAQVQHSNEMVQRTVQIAKPTKSVSGDISRASKNEKGKERPRRKKRRQAISHSQEQESRIILEAPPRQGKATELENPLPIDLNELATETKITSDHNQMPEIHAEELVPTEIERPATSAREQCKAFEPPSGYRTIDSLQFNQEQSLIGVVTWAKGVTESKGTDCYQTVTLIDPWNFNAEQAYLSDRQGYSVNIFGYDKRDLPDPKTGDILLLKTVKPSQMKQGMNVNGVVYKNKLRWAIYDSETNQVRPHSQGVTQQSNEDDDTMSGCFYTPHDQELIYCEKLAKWWQGILEKSSGIVHQVSVASVSRRIHRLISDLNENTQPDGYFDCIVEVLQGFQNEGGIYSLYVTDYTSNQSLRSHERWDKMDKMVLRLEMWDEAAKVGPSMIQGGFYHCMNCRVMSHDSYLQAKIVEKKIEKLTEDDKEQENFKKLLERKAEFELASPNRLPPLCTIQDAEPERFFNCTVEVLRTVFDNNETHIFVTDYTSNEKFMSSTPSEPWSTELDGPIVKIKVFGEGNTKKARAMSQATFYRLEKIRYWETRNKWVCHLKEGGTIRKCNSKNVVDEHFKELLRRRNEWRKSHGEESQSLIRDSASELSRSSPAQLKGEGFPDILQYPCKFTVVARIVDFYPMKLADCLVLQCQKCEKQLRGIQKACPDCTETTMEEAAVSYQCSLFFMLRDAGGKEIVVSAGDPDCSLVKNLNHNSEDEYVESLTRRLRPFLGNLVEVHNGLDRDEDIESETVDLIFTIVGWLEQTDSRKKERYGLLDCRL